MLPEQYNESKWKHLPKITIEVIPHDDQRYETCGDWYYNEKGELVIKVSETNPKYEFLVALHELTESILCDFAGVKENVVTKFDTDFEEMRNQFPYIVGDKEPGDDDNAPYTHQHRLASRVEQFVARDLGIVGDEWNKYEETINKLEQF